VDGWSTPCPCRFTPGKENPYQLHRRLGGSQCRSGEVRKISSPPGFDPGTVQPVANRYTDCAILAHTQFRNPLLTVRNSVQKVLMLSHINGCAWHTWRIAPIPPSHTHTYHTHISVCVYIYMCVCIYIYIHIHIHTHTHTHTHTQTHTRYDVSLGVRAGGLVIRFEPFLPPYMR